MSNSIFSKELESWLNEKGHKTLGNLDAKFGHKSFSVAFILLMATAALPIPTGGITHIFEIITLILAVELLIGRRSIWLPRRWRRITLGDTISRKAIPKLVSFIRWFEGFSRPRWVKIPKNSAFYSIFSFLIIIFTLSAFLAPPFSGLDTLPALGVVLLSLSVLLEDVLIFIFGLIIGSIGIYVELSLGSFVLHLFN